MFFEFSYVRSAVQEEHFPHVRRLKTPQKENLRKNRLRRHASRNQADRPRDAELQIPATMERNHGVYSKGVP